MNGLTGCGFAALTLLLSYYILLLVHFTRGFARLRRPRRPLSAPTVSVVIAARNESANLPRLFQCLNKQNYPVRLTQIILVDDRSTDASYTQMVRFASGRRNVDVLRIRRLHASISPKKAALTAGIAEATGEIILTTDADALPGPSWIREIVRWYDADTAAVLGYAPYRIDPPFDGFFHRLLALEYLSMGAVAAATAGMGTPSTCNGANFSFRRDVFVRLNGYGGTGRWISGDDDLFMQRIVRESGMTVRFAAARSAAVPNNPPAALSDFVRQRIRFSSKHLAYPRRMIAVLSGVYLFYAALLIGTFMAVFLSRWILPMLLVWAVKAVFETAFLRAGAKRLDGRGLLRFYLPLIPLHLFYVVLFPLLGQIVKPKWK
jgi:cellulose synthase/poly-beta-1,6-N-acetylglucosamine synthase-like glycosyltransferase